MPHLPPEYCPYCGSPLEPASFPGGHCPDCDEFTVQQPVVAAEVLVVHDERVLLQRRATGRKAGTWGFPGGHPEPFEVPWEAAVRELEEETGLRADPAALTLFDAVFDRNPDGTYYLVLGFSLPRDAAAGELDPTADETDGLAFRGPGELPEDFELFEPEYRNRMERAVAVVGDRDRADGPSVLDLR